MKEIGYLMNGKFPEARAGFGAFLQKARVERFYWQEYVVCMHLIPPAWAGTKRLADYVRRMGKAAQGLWVAPETEAQLAGWRQPFPEPELAALLFARQPFRENLVILTERGGTGMGSRNGVDVQDGPGQNGGTDALRQEPVRWLEDFLEKCYADLNGLYLVGWEREAETEAFLEWIYGQSGLAACVTGRMPELDGRRTSVVDLGRDITVPVKKIPAGSLYLDLTSNQEKQRFMKEKRTDISYISVRNYLDTAFKARYNVF